MLHLEGPSQRHWHASEFKTVARRHETPLWALRAKKHRAHEVNPFVGSQGPHKNSGSHIDASHSRQPLVKGERLVRYEVNAVMPDLWRMEAVRHGSRDRQ